MTESQGANQSVMGILQWTMVSERLNVTTVVMPMSKFQVAAQEEHLELLKRICGHLGDKQVQASSKQHSKQGVQLL